MYRFLASAHMSVKRGKIFGMAAWEYKMVKFLKELGNSDHELTLINMGQRGWELVSCTDGPPHVLIFKRPKLKPQPWLPEPVREEGGPP